MEIIIIWLLSFAGCILNQYYGIRFGIDMKVRNIFIAFFFSIIPVLGQIIAFIGLIEYFAHSRPDGKGFMDRKLW